MIGRSGTVFCFVVSEDLVLGGAGFVGGLVGADKFVNQVIDTKGGGIIALADPVRVVHSAGVAGGTVR